MALNPFDSRDPFFYSPMERMMARMFGDTFHDFDRSLRSVAPYWANLPAVQEADIGNAVGTIINDNEKFAVEVDVSQFRPEDLSVNINDRDLVIEGHHEERTDANGKIERHFIRKYALPQDALPETIASHLSDAGILSVSANKAAIEAPKGRNIPIQAAPRQAKSVEQKRDEKMH